MLCAIGLDFRIPRGFEVGALAMLELCLFMLTGLVLICGAGVEQLGERQRQELAALFAMPALSRNPRQWFPH